MHAPASLSRWQQRGFSLVEILVVLAIATVLMALSVGSIQRMIHSTDLTTSASTVVDTFNLARQRAISNNHPVEIRIFKVPPNSESGAAIAYRALGVYQINEAGPQLIQKLIYLNGSTELSDSELFGSLLRFTPSSSAPLRAGASGPSYDYHYFQYRCDGSTNLNPQPPSGADTWHMMIYNSNRPPTAAKPPANYISIQLDPVSGRTQTFQPGM